MADEISAAARASAPVDAATIIAVAVFYMALCTFMTAARMYARFSIHRQFWWDDWTSVVAWVGTVVLCAQQLMLMQHGGGVRMASVPAEEYDQFVKIFTDLEMVERVSIFFAKLSILLLYIRAFFPVGTYRTPMWWVIQAVIWLNFLYTVILIFVVALQCAGQGLPWGSTCIDQYLLLVLSSVINIISDFAVLLVPVASVWRLHMSRRRRWAVWALFAFGAVAPNVSIARLVYQVQLAQSTDKTVVYTIVVMLATAEQVVAIVVGAAPVAWGLLLRLRHRHKGGPESDEHENKNRPRTTSSRFWAGRESRGSGGAGSGPKRKRRTGAPDPFRITDALESQTVLTRLDAVDTDGAGSSADRDGARSADTDRERDGSGTAESWPLRDYAKTAEDHAARA